MTVKHNPFPISKRHTVLVISSGIDMIKTN